MSLEDVKSLYVISCLVLCAIIASPTILTVASPRGEQFSELWLLGPGGMAEFYPSDVMPGVLYKIYVGVGNHLGSSGNYVVYVKFRNETEPLPNSTSNTPSDLEPLYEFDVFVDDNKTWQDLMSFSFSEVSVANNVCRVGKLKVNGIAFNVNKTAAWNDWSKEFMFELFLELWLYDATLQQIQFHNRFVGLRLNMTSE